MHNREFKFGYQHFLLCQKSFLKVSSKWLLKNNSDNGKLLLGKTYSGERFRAILALLFVLKLCFTPVTCFFFLAKQMFSEMYWNQPVHQSVSVCLSVCLCSKFEKTWENCVARSFSSFAAILLKLCRYIDYILKLCRHSFQSSAPNG